MAGAAVTGDPDAFLGVGGKERRAGLEGLNRREPGNSRVVRIAGQVREHDVLSLVVKILSQEARHLVVRGVPVAAHDPLLQRPGIERAGAEHLDFVIRFYDQNVRTAHRLGGKRVDVSQVDRDAHFDAISPDCEGHRVGGVVRNRERAEAERPDLEILRRRYGLAPANEFLLLAKLAGFERGVRNVNWRVQRLRERHESPHVVAVFVRDDDGVEPRGVFADRMNAPDRLSRTQAAIDQYTRAASDYQSRIARTTAGEYANAHWKK